jgi:predicted pyridoxine 5'-phosphate oxidase superfamily flavin-nucleotide-binding protein
MDSFADHMFSDAAKAEQAKAGSRARNEQAYKNRLTNGLQDDAIAFIQSRTSFCIASITETGWPYVQHRGGPAGFLKVIAPDTLGFADYHGNQQFITQGNLATQSRVSLFLMDYPRRARLKLIGHARMIDAAENPALAAQLATQNQGHVERLTTIKIVAQDWNCAKHIEQRFTEAEIQSMPGPRIAELDRHIATLSARLSDLGQDPAALLNTPKETK